MSQTPTQEQLQDGFMHDFNKSLGEKPKTPAPRVTLPPQPDMNKVLEDLKKHGDGWGDNLGKKGGRKSRSARKKRRKTKKRTHKKRKTKRSKKRRATRSA